jgi:hypothetical protein
VTPSSGYGLSDRAGALGFGDEVFPPVPRRKFKQTLDLVRLQETAEVLVRDELPSGPNAIQVQARLSFDDDDFRFRLSVNLDGQGKIAISRCKRDTS